MAHTFIHTPMLPRSLLTNGKMCQIHSPVTGIKCQRCASSGHFFLTFIVLTEPGNPKRDLFFFFFCFLLILTKLFRCLNLTRPYAQHRNSVNATTEPEETLSCDTNKCSVSTLSAVCNKKSTRPTFFSGAWARTSSTELVAGISLE